MTTSEAIRGIHDALQRWDWHGDITITRVPITDWRDLEPLHPGAGNTYTLAITRNADGARWALGPATADALILTIEANGPLHPDTPR